MVVTRYEMLGTKELLYLKQPPSLGEQITLKFKSDPSSIITPHLHRIYWKLDLTIVTD